MIIYSFDESIHLSSNPRTQWIGKPVRNETTGVVIGQVVSMVNSSGLYQVSLDVESTGIFYAGITSGFKVQEL
jgi:hypothetical protein